MSQTMSKELRQTLQVMLVCGFYSGICIMLAMIGNAYFQSIEAIGWLNCIFVLAAFASLEYYLMLQCLISSVIMVVIHIPEAVVLGGLLLIAAGIILLLSEEISTYKHNSDQRFGQFEHIPVDAPKCGVAIFMAILVALLNDYEIWVGAQMTGLLFTYICAFGAAQKLEEPNT